jgi:hypothetical protein
VTPAMRADGAPLLEREGVPVPPRGSPVLGLWRRRFLRVGVVVCVAVAIGTAALKLDDALGIFDLRADINSALTYSGRTHTYPEWSPAAGSVFEAALLWMPRDARYRVAYGPGFDARTTSDFSHQLIYDVLLPRRPTRSESAPWVFCYGCDARTLAGLDVIAGTPGGPVFGRPSS